MKKCPNCKQIYADDVQFCLADGSALFANSEDSSSFETVFMKQPPYIPAVPSASSSAKSSIPGWIFAIFGGLIVLIGVMAWMLFISGSNDKKNTGETGSGNELALKNNQTNTVPPQDNQSLTEQPKKALNPTFTSQNTSSMLNPSGKWTGSWNSKTISFKAEMNLTVDNSGQGERTNFLVSSEYDESEKNRQGWNVGGRIRAGNFRCGVADALSEGLSQG